MKTLLFVAITLFSGASAGLVHGAVNLAAVEPYLDSAIEIENRQLIESGEAEDTPQFRAEYERYREWQKGGQLVAGVVMGTAVGSLFGIVYSLSRNSLPGGGDVAKSLLLAGAMWFVLYVVPMLKYPANPPTVGDAGTLVFREVLYVAFVAVSGAAALASYGAFKRLGRRRAVLVPVYGAIVLAAFLLLPENPDENTAPADLVHGFRLMSAVGVTSFWAAVGAISGLLWRRFGAADGIRNDSKSME